MSNEELACKLPCQDLMVNIAWALDRNAADEAADLFAEDGVLESAEGHVSGPALRAALKKRSPDITTHHILSNMYVRPLDATNAEARAYVMVYRAPTLPDTLPRPMPATPGGAGLWQMRFRKTPQGWRISRMAMAPKLAPKA